MRMDSVRGLRAGARWAAVSILRTSGLSEMVEAEIERVEVAPAALRQVGRCAIRDQRYALLGNAAVRAQRRVEARKVVAALPAADDGEALGDDDEIADAIFGQLEARAGIGARQDEVHTAQRRDAGAHVVDADASLDVDG